MAGIEAVTSNILTWAADILKEAVVGAITAEMIWTEITDKRPPRTWRWETMNSQESAMTNIAALGQTIKSTEYEPKPYDPGWLHGIGEDGHEFSITDVTYHETERGKIISEEASSKGSDITMFFTVFMAYHTAQPGGDKYIEWTAPEAAEKAFNVIASHLSGGDVNAALVGAPESYGAELPF